MLGHHRYLKPAVWNDGRLVVLWNESGTAGATGLTLSRHAADGVRHGESIVIPTEQRPDRLYLATTGGEYGFIWSNADEYAYRVFFQRATFCD